MTKALIEFKTIKDFKRIYEVTKALGMPIAIRLEEDRILTLGIDQPRVTAIRVSIPVEELLEYEADEDVLSMEPKDRTILLDHKAVTPVMKKASSDEPLWLKWLDDDRVEVGTGSNRKVRVVTSPLNVDLLEVPEEPFKIEYGGTVTLYAKIIKDVLSMLKDMGGEVHVKILEEGLRFWTDNDTSEMDVMIPLDDPQIVSVEADVGVESIYGIGYLLPIVKAMQSSDIVKMEFGEDQPLKLDTKLGEKGEFTILVAPRVKEDEE